MPSDTHSLIPPSIFDHTSDELRECLQSGGLPGFRAAQVLDWVYRKDAADPVQMTNISAADREFLSSRITFAQARIIRRQVAADGTVKLLLSWTDGKVAESVMIPDGRRRTACVSSQVGCPVGCRFCASGMGGMKGNLSAGQIIEQVVHLNRILAAENSRIGNVVFMGMGEPLANYANSVKAVRILHDRQCLNLGTRRITISTVGVPDRIRALAEEGLPVNLALSLHAPNESLRRQLIPWAEHFALDEILDAVRFYFERTGREVTFEYILLSEVNDRPEHARQLATLCTGIRANVNLIRYNQVEGLPYRRPENAAVVRFQEILRKAGINAHVRKSRGRDIDAACGQLRRRATET